ncbi:helix-turn-helix transcriptional regulator [Neolewinella persica]|uniref:helix-turn-helix transcriptional regulator n=1 Tax=Neolewinella persica TaxID=70998 RepID=UPI000369AEB9|nr:WYL domain-containing protein [Neolewinella persica]
MPTNKNALIRYRTIDKCLQNTGRKWTLTDLIDACSDALYEYEGKDTYVSKRTVQLDIQFMRSDKLGYLAPIEVYGKKYYRYAEPGYTITEVPLTETDLDILSESMVMLRQFKDFSLFTELNGVIQKLEDKIYREAEDLEPIIHLDKNEGLKGLQHLDTLYQAILKRVVLKLTYQSFSARKPDTFSFHGFILKEFNNRWFLVGRKHNTKPILTLALDRISQIDLDLKTDYDRRDFSPSTYYQDTFGVTVYNSPPAEIVLWVSRNNTPYVLTKPFHHSQRVIETRKDRSVVIGLTLHMNFELERLLLGFGDGMEVLKPAALRKRIKTKLTRARGFYE